MIVINIAPAPPSIISATIFTTSTITVSMIARALIGALRVCYFSAVNEMRKGWMRGFGACLVERDGARSGRGRVEKDAGIIGRDEIHWCIGRKT